MFFILCSIDLSSPGIISCNQPIYCRKKQQKQIKALKHFRENWDRKTQKLTGMFQDTSCNYLYLQRMTQKGTHVISNAISPQNLMVKTYKWRRWVTRSDGHDISNPKTQPSTCDKSRLNLGVFPTNARQTKLEYIFFRFL